jgi:hypothetical protein
MALTTEIGLVKSEIASSIGASLYNAKDLVYVSKAIEALANAEASGGTFVDANLSGILYVGSGAAGFSSAAALTNPVAVFNTTAADYAQIAFKNSSTSADASTDFIAYSNNGSDTDGYIDMGITSSNFADAEFTITGKGDGYIFMVGAAGGTDQGNLVFATAILDHRIRLFLLLVDLLPIMNRCLLPQTRTYILKSTPHQLALLQEL